jgi:class 3 adenylate cyclase
VIGDTVNTASRLQSLTHELGIPLVVGDALVAAIARE